MSVPQTRCTDLIPISPSLVTSTAFVASDGFKTEAELPTLRRNLAGHRGMPHLMFVGSDADEETYSAKLFGILRITDGTVSPAPAPIYLLKAMATYAVVLGSTQLPSTSPVAPDAFVADAAVPTLTPFGTYIAALYARDKVQEVTVENGLLMDGWPDLGNLWGIAWEFDMTGAAGGNVLMSLGT